MLRSPVSSPSILIACGFHVCTDVEPPLPFSLLLILPAYTVRALLAAELLHAGADLNSYRNSLHAYHIASGTWSDRSSPLGGVAPAARYDLGFGAINGRLYVFAGYTNSGAMRHGVRLV
eukprot:3825589-Rhodomonas_salina.2